MRINFVLILFLAFPIDSLISQQLGATYEWYEGVILTKNGDTILGELNYNHPKKLLLQKDSASVKSYSSRNVEYFRFFDPTIRLIRTYSRVEFYRAPDFLTSEFFELVINGKITVVREGYITKFKEINYSYYGLVEKELTPLKRFQKDLLPGMKTQKPELRNLIEEQGLKAYKKFDRLVIIDMYNALSDSTYQRKIGNNYATQRLMNNL